MEVARQEAAAGAPARTGAARVALVLGSYVLFRWLLEVVRLPERTPAWALGIASLVVSVGAIGLPILAIVTLVRGSRSVRGALLTTALGLGLWLGLLAAGKAAPPALQALSAALQDLGKILAAVGVGIALAAALKEPNILLPAGLFAAFADFVVVKFGTVKHALSTAKGQALIQSVSARVPAIHPGLGSALTIGPADFLFLGVFLACAARFGLGLARNAVVLTVFLAGSLLVVQLPGVGALPALAPMSLAFIGANWRQFKLTRQELLSTGVVLVLMGGLFLGYFLFLFPAKK
jgi:hypothetical protein